MEDKKGRGRKSIFTKEINAELRLSDVVKSKNVQNFTLELNGYNLSIIFYVIKMIAGFLYSKNKIVIPGDKKCYASHFSS